MRVQASGGLSHRFHGTYSAAVGLRLDNEREAEIVRRKLGEAWIRKGRLLLWNGEREALEALKQQWKEDGFSLTFPPCGLSHCEGQCANESIDGVPHSIDVGPPFTLVLEVEDPDQGGLFGGFSSDADLPPFPAPIDPNVPRLYAKEIVGTWCGVEIPPWLRAFDCRTDDPPTAPWGEILFSAETAEVDLGLKTGRGSGDATMMLSTSGRSYIDVTDLAETVHKMITEAKRFLREYEHALCHPPKDEGGSGHYKPVAIEISNHGWSVIGDRRHYAAMAFGVRKTKGCKFCQEK